MNPNPWQPVAFVPRKNKNMQNSKQPQHRAKQCQEDPGERRGFRYPGNPQKIQPRCKAGDFFPSSPESQSYPGAHLGAAAGRLASTFRTSDWHPSAHEFLLRIRIFRLAVAGW